MKRFYKAAIFATTVLTPAAVLAQSAPPSGNACDQLIIAIDRQGTSQTTITRQQALDYQSKGDVTSCNTALTRINTQAANTANTPATGTQNAQSTTGNVQVTQGAPQVTVQQQPPTVTINQGQPEIIIHQPAPIVTVEIPPPDVTVRLPMPGVSVTQAQPQVSVTEAKPQVNVVPPAQQAQAVITAQQNPVVQFNADKAQVTVKQSDQPTIHVEQQAAANANTPAGQQTAANQPNSAQNQNSATGQLQTKQVPASDLVGKQVTTANNNDVGKITEAVMDAKNEPFVIVQKNGMQYAVDVNFTYMKGNNLLLNTTADPNTLPVFNDSQLQANGMHKLNDSQTVTVAQAAG